MTDYQIRDEGISSSQTEKLLYDDKREKELHMNAVKMIAVRNGIAVEEVTRVYEIVLRRFKRSARIKDFLPIFVGRKVEYLFNKRKMLKQTKDL